MTKQPLAASGLPFNGLHPGNPCNYMDYYSLTDPEGRKTELTGWLTNSGHFTHNMVTRQALIKRRSGKVCKPKTGSCLSPVQCYINSMHFEKKT